MAISNEQVVALLKKNPVVTGAVALSLLLAGTIYLRGDQLPAAATLLEEKAVEGQRLAANIKNSAQLPEQLARVSAATREIDGRLVRVGQLADNLQYFYKLETGTGITFLDLRQTTAPSRGPKTEKIPVGFSLTLHGSYQQVLEFLRRVESGTHYSRVKSVSLAPFDEAANSGGMRSDATKLTLNLELLGAP
jgi:hypothetical protein